MPETKYHDMSLNSLSWKQSDIYITANIDVECIYITIHSSLPLYLKGASFKTEILKNIHKDTRQSPDKDNNPLATENKWNRSSSKPVKNRWHRLRSRTKFVISKLFSKKWKQISNKFRRY